MKPIFNFVLTDYERKIKNILLKTSYPIGDYFSVVSEKLISFILTWNDGYKTMIKPLENNGVSIIMSTGVSIIPVNRVDEVMRFIQMYNSDSYYDWVTINFFKAIEENGVGGFAMILKTILMFGDSFDENNMQAPITHLLRIHSDKHKYLTDVVYEIVFNNSTAEIEYKRFVNIIAQNERLRCTLSGD